MHILEGTMLFPRKCLACYVGKMSLGTENDIHCRRKILATKEKCRMKKRVASAGTFNTSLLNIYAQYVHTHFVNIAREIFAMMLPQFDGEHICNSINICRHTTAHCLGCCGYKVGFLWHVHTVDGDVVARCSGCLGGLAGDVVAHLWVMCNTWMWLLFLKFEDSVTHRCGLWGS